MSSGNNNIPNVAHCYEDRVIKETAVEKNRDKTKILEHYDLKTGTKRKNSDASGEEKKKPKH